MWNDSLHDIINDNAGNIINFITSKIFAVTSRMIQQHNIHQLTCTSSDAKIDNQIANSLEHRWRHKRTFGAADCDTDPYLVVANLWE
jgi:hypothetical protein